MFTNRIKSAARVTAVAAVVGASVFGTAGVAFAVPTSSSDDETYLAALAEEGISFPSDSKAIALAEHVCDSFDSGVSFEELIDEGRDQSELSDYEIGYVIGAAVYVYCPEFESEISA